MSCMPGNPVIGLRFITKSLQLARPSVSHANAKLEMTGLDCNLLCMLKANTVRLHSESLGRAWGDGKP